VSGPLAGVRVVELAGVGPAPYCGMLLADLGADVVRVDRVPAGPPRTGPAEGLDALVDGILGRGRRSVALDLKHPDGLAAARDLVARADALVEGFRPGVTERLGLGPRECLARNPRLVYGRLTGWGQDGPLAATAGHDLDYIAVAGVLAHVGNRGGRPVPPLNLVGDFAGGGLLMAFGIAAALVETSRSGRGQVVDAAMVDGAASLMTMMFEMHGRGGWDERRGTNANDSGSHFYDTYETADGGHVAVAAMEPRFHAELLDRLGLTGDPAFADQWNPATWDAASARLAAVFRTRTRAEWADVFAGSDACVAPVLTMSEAPRHPHNVARGTFVEVAGVPQPGPVPRFDRTPGAVARAAPTVGEHTEEVLGELGRTPERIAELVASGAAAAPGRLN